MLLLRTAAIRRLEQHHLATAQPPLMEQAGQAAADYACELMQDRCGAILVIAGAGNNGGDAYVCARYLKARGHSVIVASPASNHSLPPDAAAARDDWLAMGTGIAVELPPVGHYALAIDGLFGIGLSSKNGRSIESPFADWIALLNALSCPVLALDVPSGLDADSGAIVGSCVRATHTITFIAAKPGLYMQAGRDHAGNVRCANLGIEIDPREADGDEGRLISTADFESALQARLHNSHKGTHGNAAIIGGAPGMAGAALLAGRAALHLGAGRVYLGMLETLPVDYAQPELMLREVADAIAQASHTNSAIGIGPGLGKSEGALTALRLAIAADVPLVIDADALNLIAAHPVLSKHIARRAAPTVLTPHPTEAARLLDCDTAAVQADRIGSAQALAQHFNAAVVLKGSGSVVALPAGENNRAHWYVNGSGNGGLATAGSGDVLLGFVTALLAQGNHGGHDIHDTALDANAALLAAVHLHGAAADLLVETGTGPVGLTAGELIAPARDIWNDWIVSE
jgi:ADP-dependent NAD(P)H-hydrate dehydratase / NAD(P)H-hydrate epimerase